jgi:hypothetical protein
MPTLTGRAFKVTVVLNSAEVAALSVPNGSSRVILKISASGRAVTADISGKSLRKAQATIGEAGVDGCVAILQGKLEAQGGADVITEAGLVAQIKAPKQVAEG